MKKDEILYVVIPCYNEEEVLEETTRQLKVKLESLIKEKKISKNSRVMYVNDGSKDKTWELIKQISEKEKLFTGISLSRNRGHQNALLGGLMTAKNYADIIIRRTGRYGYGFACPHPSRSVSRDGFSPIRRYRAAWIRQSPG